MNPIRSLFPGMNLALLGFISVLIIIFRAWNQDLTIDEANTYHFYISKLTPDFWWAGSNNHLLASLLIRLSTSIFGYSPFAMRLPAVIGGVIYIGCAAILVSLLLDKSRRWSRAWLYAVLVFNPFIMDYLVAARGYSPALACEMAMLVLIYQIVSGTQRDEDVPSRWIYLSVLGALGVAFNYSFLFSFSSLLFCTFVFAVGYRYSKHTFTWSYAVIMGARAFVLFIAIIILICSNNIITMPKSEISIGWGCDSAVKMLNSFSQLTFNGPNPFLTPPGMRHTLKFVSAIAPYLTLILFILSILLLTIRWKVHISRMAKKLVVRMGQDPFVWTIVGAFVLSLALHSFLFLVLGIKLPRSRTGIHLIPLFSLIAAAPLYLWYNQKDKISTFFAKGYSLSVGLIALLFIFSLHFAYFQEWKWNADVCTATDIALRYADEMHTKNVEISWEYDAAGNYYGQYLGYGVKRLNNGPEDQLLINKKTDKLPTIYMLSRRVWGVINQDGLIPVYESRLSGTIVAIQNAGNSSLPETPVHFQVNMAPPCHEHGWFGKSNDYPGAEIY